MCEKMCNNECITNAICKHNEECYADACFSGEQLRVVDKWLADERRKFAIWLDKKGYMRKMDLNISRVEEALYEYEKEQK